LDFDALKYMPLIVSIGASSLGHERRAGMAGNTASEGSIEDQQVPSSETLMVPSLKLTASVAPLRTVPISENLLASVPICKELSLGRRR